ncbi:MULTISPECIES: UDP-2,3-diacylglucosamine diphosphatase [unclassified Aureimonas]|uniref:UDP-2,3-diacylglucosamine diphosphatase n=1 Tax=unclassified Aureimonas TaxID=2615206 RepID=UPI0006FE2B83|nr:MULTISPECIES: UDP-2,3-diacylglucosamine diphosphatase [unclassified Aureimonas]KQT57399.1 UDP-2,3-diacylglucosamine hydrolase [Aureimonas sp. Leaf427]KQT77078.1 UDP-2,3-diacylglucosamine hydrolase [Aureimonas sp. Leaf460]
MNEATQQRHFRTLFISDVHLGSKAAQADLLIDFLRLHDAEKIYLVGDIVDGWRLKRAWHWPQSHNDVVQKLLRKARKGTEIVYIPGNHDEFLRSFQGTHFGGIEVRQNDVHVTADGRRFLVIHGDEFDVVVRNARLIAYLGDWAYDAAIAINVVFNKARRAFGFPYWSISSWAKLKVKNAVSFIGTFETALAEEAARHGCDGVICGHIHHAEIAVRGGIHYVNTGDWVESCTAVAERHDGTLEMIRWTQLVEQTAHPRRRPPLEIAVSTETAAEAA